MTPLSCFENIYRYNRRKGHAANAGGYSGTKEIALAVMATTLSWHHLRADRVHHWLCKRYMNQFGLEMAMSILVSMLVAFTLTPITQLAAVKAARGQ